MKKFNYKDSFVAVREWHYGNFPEQMQRTCFCCRRKINNCNVTLLVNNYKYIPNVILHSDCFKEWENKPEELCDSILLSYRAWKRDDEIFG